VYPEIAYLDILAVFILDHLLRSAYLFFYGGYSLLHLNFKNTMIFFFFRRILDNFSVLLKEINELEN